MRDQDSLSRPIVVTANDGWWYGNATTNAATNDVATYDGWNAITYDGRWHGNATTNDGHAIANDGRYARYGNGHAAANDGWNARNVNGNVTANDGWNAWNGNARNGYARNDATTNDGRYAWYGHGNGYVFLFLKHYHHNN